MKAKVGEAGSYETIRDGTIKFSGLYAKRLQLKAQRPCDCWHLDGEVLDMFLIFSGLKWDLASSKELT